MCFFLIINKIRPIFLQNPANFQENDVIHKAKAAYYVQISIYNINLKISGIHSCGQCLVENHSENAWPAHLYDDDDI